MCTGPATSCSNTVTRHVAATNRFVCTGEFLWKPLSPQQNFVATTSRNKWPVETSISRCLISPCKSLLSSNVFNLIYFDWSRSFWIRRWARLMEHGFCSVFFTLIKRAQVTQRANLGKPVVPIVFFPKKRNDHPLNYIWNARNAPTRLNSNEIWLLISVRRSKCCVPFLLLEGDQTFLAHCFIHEKFSKLN